MTMQALFFNDIRTGFIAHILKELYIERIYAPFVEGRQGLTIVDAGANVGLTSYYFHPFAAKIVAIEPDWEHFECLTQMLNFNQLTQVIPTCCALAGECGHRDFFSFPGNATMHSLRPAPGSRFSRQVRTETLPSLMKHYRLGKVDLLKLDVEGAEAEILRSPSFCQAAPKIETIVGEWHAWSGISQREVQDLCCMAGFRFRWLKADASLFVASR